MKRPAMLALVALALAVGLWLAMRPRNITAFLALIRRAESGDDYYIIAGGDHFTDTREHPFVLDPGRAKPLGTTASGAYQMVRGTWALARDALGLTDFSPASQDAAAEWLLRYKVPGENAMQAEGTGVYELVEAGQFDEAMARLGPEWEAFAKMAVGRYHLSLDDAREFIESQGGTYSA